MDSALALLLAPRQMSFRTRGQELCGFGPLLYRVLVPRGAGTLLRHANRTREPGRHPFPEGGPAF